MKMRVSDCQNACVSVLGEGERAVMYVRDVDKEEAREATLLRIEEEILTSEKHGGRRCSVQDVREEHVGKELMLQCSESLEAEVKLSCMSLEAVLRTLSLCLHFGVDVSCLFSCVCMEIAVLVHVLMFERRKKRVCFFSFSYFFLFNEEWIVCPLWSLSGLSIYSSSMFLVFTFDLWFLLPFPFS